MKICAIICEFNPFHNGHKYLIENAKKASGCDYVLCVLSGDFVQRAYPAILPKGLRTRSALKNGADIVVELPFLYATSVGENFAKGAIEIISQFDNITHLAFGCENDNINILNAIASISLNETDSFKNSLKEILKSGMSYPTAYSKTVSMELEKRGFDSSMCDIILSKPNNLLAIEYLKQIKKHSLDITPLPIKRQGSDYNEQEIAQNFSSATAIRNCIYEKQLDLIENNVPQNVLNELMESTKTHLPDIGLFNNLLLFALKNNELIGLSEGNDILSKKLKSNALAFNDLNKVLESTKSKNYTLARLRRLALNALFDVKKEDVANAPLSPIKLLGIKEELLRDIKGFPKNIIIQNKDYENLDKSLYKKYILLEEKVASIYSQITCRDGYSLYSYKLEKI